MKKLAIFSVIGLFGCILIFYGVKTLIIKPAKLKIYMIVKSDNPNSNDFWALCKAGAETAVKEMNCDLIYAGPNTETDISSQIQIVKNAIKSKPDAIILAASDYNALNSVAKKAENNHIVFITMDSDISGNVPRSFIGTDNISASKEIGKYLASLINNTGDIGIISFVNNSSTAIDRDKGFRDALKEYKQIKILPTEFCGSDAQKSYELAKHLLITDNRIKGLFGANQWSLEGIVKAVKELHKEKDVSVVGFDSSIPIIEGLEGGEVKVLEVQKPFNMGYESVKAAVDKMNGKKLPFKIYIPSVLITKSNMYDQENEKLLFPFVD